MRILTSFALLIPAFSLLCTPQPLTLLFHRAYNAPLPNVSLNRICQFLAFLNLTRFARQIVSSTDKLCSVKRCLSFGAGFEPR